MQIKYLGKDNFELKAKDAVINLGQAISIDGFSLPGPGEYEKSSVFIEGIPDNGTTIYLIKAEDINICFLGNISHQLKESEAKEIGDVDILFLPLGEEGSLPIKKAIEMIPIIDPRIVIPMLYNEEGLAEFKKSEGSTSEDLDIFRIKKAELPEDERRTVILKTM